MPPSRAPAIVGSIPYYRIEDFPIDGEPEGARYLLITSSNGDGCVGHLDGAQWITDGGDPITPIYWGRIPAVG
jgi:hypothetical protein